MTKYYCQLLLIIKICEAVPSCKNTFSCRLLVYPTPGLYKKIRPTREPQFTAISPQQLKNVHVIIR